MKISYEVLENIAYAVEGEVRTDYSGRGMFGDTCAGIVFEGDAIALGIAIAENVEHEELVAYLRNHARSDSMGYDTITYWSGLVCDDAPDEEED